MNFWKRKNSKGDKIIFYYDLGREPGQRPSTNVFVYTRPKDQVQKNHNKEALALLEVLKSQTILEQQAIGSGFIPQHKFKGNFLDYYEEYVKLNTRKGNRHLKNSLNHFKSFLGKNFIAPIDISENLCKRFRQYLLDRFTGETPGNYFARFKWVINAAHCDGYFRVKPTDKVYSKSNPSIRLKENLECTEYIQLLNTPCINEEVKEAFVFCCYTGLRWVDVKAMRWIQVNGATLTTRIIQAKTGQRITLTLHPIARAILKKRQQILAEHFDPKEIVFRLPTADGANKVLDKWVGNTAIQKHITWSCARLSFSILLQDRHVDDATVAYLMGHNTTEQVRKTYKRHRPKDQSASIGQLPNPELQPYFLHL